MGFRFNKRVKLLPGVTLNVGKKGASVSVGGRGAKVNVGQKGVRTTVGIPGTGMSYSEYTPYNANKAQQSPQATASGWKLSPVNITIAALLLLVLGAGKGYAIASLLPIGIVIFACYAWKKYRRP